MGGDQQRREQVVETRTFGFISRSFPSRTGRKTRHIQPRAESPSGGHPRRGPGADKVNRRVHGGQFGAAVSGLKAPTLPPCMSGQEAAFRAPPGGLTLRSEESVRPNQGAARLTARAPRGSITRHHESLVFEPKQESRLPAAFTLKCRSSDPRSLRTQLGDRLIRTQSEPEDVRSSSSLTRASDLQLAR